MSLIKSFIQTLICHVSVYITFICSMWKHTKISKLTSSFIQLLKQRHTTHTTILDIGPSHNDPIIKNLGIYSIYSRMVMLPIDKYQTKFPTVPFVPLQPTPGWIFDFLHGFRAQKTDGLISQGWWFEAYKLTVSWELLPSTLSKSPFSYTLVWRIAWSLHQCLLS